MHIETLPLGPIETNCFVAWNDEREALVIDPGADAPIIDALIKRHQLKVVGYPITHGHADHLCALADMVALHPAPIGMHPKDQEWAFTDINQVAPFYGTPKDPGPIERSYAEGQTWTDASFTYTVMETPGHSPGSVSFYFPEQGVLFGGDVLFQGGVGRTDLPGGDPLILRDSLKRLAQLPDDTRVLPGHGPATTIGIEKATNYYMQHGLPPYA